MKIIADDKIPFLKGALEKAGAEVFYLPGAKITKSVLADADGLIIRTRTKCNGELLSGTKVKFIATATIGYDHIDTLYCEKNGISWTNAPGCNSSSVAQYFCSAILNIAVERRLDLSAMTIGIIGVGNVGAKVARSAELLGMKVLLNDPPRERTEGHGKFVTVKKIKEEADIITLHVPLARDGEDRTFHLADENFFRGIRRKPLFINSSRGEVTDTEALKKAIKDGTVSCAVLDVWENEPDIDRELLALVKFATPHIAGYSTDGKANGTAMSVRAASRFFGLGLDDWYPENVPLPKETVIKISGKSLDNRTLTDIVNFSYNIRSDDAKLRKSPETFEKQRGDYPLRREFPSFSVDSRRLDPETISQLKKLGFTLGGVHRNSGRAVSPRPPRTARRAVPTFKL